jgi:hydrogenase expression/formation protein HypC
MCLAIPGRIIAIEENQGSRTAQVQFGGITRAVHLDFIPEAAVGDFVLVHVGFAISRVDPEEAERTYRLLEELGMLESEALSAEESPGRDQAPQ